MGLLNCLNLSDMEFGKLKFTPEDFQKAAITYRKSLLMVPIIGLNEVLKYMTSRPGVAYEERVGKITGKAQLRPYNPTEQEKFDVDVKWRGLRTFLGSAVLNFEPNSAVQTILGSMVTKGDGQKAAPTAQAVLTLIANGISDSLYNNFWTAKRAEDGSTTAELFDGFDTITAQEIEKETISKDKKNFIEIPDVITSANAVDVAKEILYSLDPLLRRQKCYMFCSQEFADAYNEGYLLTHAATPYNRQFDQIAVEGSAGRLVLVPLANKADSSFIHVSPQSNMLVGYDTLNNLTSVSVEKYAPFILTYVATMFFGVQFQSIDKEDLFVAKIKPGKEQTQSEPEQTEQEQTENENPVEP